MRHWRAASVAAAVAASFALGIVAAVFPVHAPAASAHGGSDSSHYLCVINGITPPDPELTASVVRSGELITVNYAGKQLVIIKGYYGEPYLRITANGTEENQLSPSRLLNQEMFTTIPLDPGKSVTSPPQWKAISTQRSAQWHDHRIHWMRPDRPAAVATDPGHDHVIGRWTVDLTVGATPMQITGTLNWLAIQKTSLAPAFGVVGLSVGVLGAVILWIWARRRRAVTPSAA